MKRVLSWILKEQFSYWEVFFASVIYAALRDANYIAAAAIFVVAVLCGSALKVSIKD